ncbi:hypothetical protein Tco_1161385, partial [Tanacetum coccineum]
FLSEDLTELGKSESYEFMLNHKGDDKIAIFIGLNRDMTIEIKNESWNNRFVDFKETIKANVCEETLDVVGFVVGSSNSFCPKKRWSLREDQHSPSSFHKSAVSSFDNAVLLRSSRNSFLVSNANTFIVSS